MDNELIAINGPVKTKDLESRLDQLEVKEIFDDDAERDLNAAMPFGGVSLVQFLAGAGEAIPPWWSQARDIALRNFWKDGDHISGTVNTLRDMMIAIPNSVVPRDTTIKAHIKQAKEFTQRLHNDTVSRSSLVGKGWSTGFGPFIQDYLTQDNGGWLVVDGAGDASQPVVGEATRLIHLDSGRVWRTGSQEFPIIFTDFDGQRHTIHHTRVINLTSMSSPIIEMYGVGFSALSRAIQISQNLIDISNYKLEKLGSRPMRAIMAINTTGQQRRAVQAVSNALAKADAAMDNIGLKRFSQMPIVGINGEIELIDLASLPDGFNETESVGLGMSVLALAFGVDVRQLAFAIGVSGQTKADAQVQHMKMRGKTPGVILQTTIQEVNSKFLPPHLKLVFDWQDDEQDAAVAKIQETRSKTRKSNLETATTTVRVERENMVKNNEITEQQFVQLELGEGRLSDGTDVLALFESTDRRIIELLDLGVDDPRDVEMNDPAVIGPEIKAAKADVEQMILRNRDLERSRQVLAALEALQLLYEKPSQEVEAVRLSPQQLRSVTDTLQGVSTNEVNEETAVDLITSIGITEERARRMVSNAKGGQAIEQVVEDIIPEGDEEMLKSLKRIILGKGQDQIQVKETGNGTQVILPPIKIPNPVIQLPAITLPPQQTNILVEPQPPPNIVVNVPEQEVNVTLPEVVVNLDNIEVKQSTPHVTVEVPETETEIIRDNQGLISKTIRRHKK